MKKSLSFGAFVIVALLVGGTFYWAVRERSQPASSPKNVAEAPAPPVESSFKGLVQMGSRRKENEFRYAHTLVGLSKSLQHQTKTVSHIDNADIHAWK
jgi:hypothetical protein